ncbi:MAG: hypothetical protein Q7U80_03120 [Thiobacillus sp.]|nr:hypothetical protein [Thiobacillus sp.]
MFLLDKLLPAEAGPVAGVSHLKHPQECWRGFNACNENKIVCFHGVAFLA